MSCRSITPFSLSGEHLRVACRAAFDDETFEIVVVVILARFMLDLVMRLAVGDLVLGRAGKPQQHVGGQYAVGGAHKLYRAAEMARDFPLDLFHRRAVQQIGLVEDDHVGCGELVLEQFLQRAFMIERRVGRALRIDRVLVFGEPAFRHRAAVDHGHDAVHGHALADCRPVERADQRLRQRKAGCLDDDVVDAPVLVEDRGHRGQEIIGNRAADAAIGEFDDVVLAAGLVAAALEDVAIDAEVAELVDDQRDAPPIGIGEQVADECRLARAKKAGDHRCRDLRRRDLAHLMLRSGLGR